MQEFLFENFRRLGSMIATVRKNEIYSEFRLLIYYLYIRYLMAHRPSSPTYQTHILIGL